MSKPLYSERKATAQMGRVRLLVHRVVRGVYFALPPTRFGGRAWSMYRRSWPR